MTYPQPEVEQHNTSAAYNDALERGWAAGTSDRDAGLPPRWVWADHGDEYLHDAFVEGYVDAYPTGD